jgi:tetratricopeptide (TPR) repeat protein
MSHLQPVVALAALMCACSSPAGGVEALPEPAPVAALPAPRSRADLPIGAQAWSVDGRALYASPLTSVEFARRSAALDEARKAWDAAPADPDALIWVGRRLGYLWRMREAIDLFTVGVEQHPEDARMLRHRGHRYVSVREFDNAIADLERAAKLVAGKPDEVEPDGVPNARGIPLETLQSNIHYHLGLARYLVGDFAGAERAYRDGFAVSKNADNQSSATHWLYLSLRRQGKLEEAERVLEPIRGDLEIHEYHGYFQLCRAYQGALDMEKVYADAKAKGGVEAASVGYGAGAWHLVNGRTARATEIFREVVASDTAYAFGFIASEVELVRLATE